MTARIDAHTFKILLGDTHISVRHTGAIIEGGTTEYGVDKRPDEIIALARRVGRLAELRAMLQPAPREIRIGDDRRGGAE